MSVRRSVVVCAVASVVSVTAACSKKPEPQFDKDKAPAAEAPKNTEPTPVPTPAPTEPARPATTREPTSPDPIGGKFSLAEATAELPKKGKLLATIETDEGTLECKLFDDKAPITVANFVGLARG